MKVLCESQKLFLLLYIALDRFCVGHPLCEGSACFLPTVRHAGEGGGGFMGWVIRIIFDPNTRQWGGGGGLWGR